MKDLSLTSNKLKQIAILAMFFDHFTAVFISHDIVIGMALRLPGTIMCFMIAEGYYKTSNVKKIHFKAFDFRRYITYPL